MNENMERPHEILQDDINNVPFHRFLGLKAENFDVKNRCIFFDMQDSLVGNPDYKILHGGVIATLIDIEGAFVLIIDGAWHPTKETTAMSSKMQGGTIDLHVDYLRPGRGKRFVVSGTILRSGNKVAVVRTELRNEQKELIATGTATYLIG